ncbi:uncharacterized protein TrAFT101_000546 [Trichoderma asperellum]|uniref:uncharacterized protein n=1 Tax=Trichoderma asperellum TaxID=101201 RepID=UPI0033206C4D|nr:hypothetical protein TrAFT101_000546 [Trichoderma asperellum]
MLKVMVSVRPPHNHGFKDPIRRPREMMAGLETRWRSVGEAEHPVVKTRGRKQREPERNSESRNLGHQAKRSENGKDANRYN